MKWPRKNDAESIQARRDAIRGVVGDAAARPRRRGLVAGAGVAHRRRRDPGLGRRAARRRARRVRARGAGRDAARDRPRAGGAARPARAHGGRALGLDVARDEGGGDLGRIPNIRASRQNDTCILLCLQRHRRRCAPCKVARGLARRAPRLPRRARRPVALEAGEAARGEDARRRADVPRPLGLDDRRRVRAEHDDPQQLRAEHGLRDAAGAGEAGARDPRGEHGRRQEAVVRVLPVRARQDGARRGDARRRDRAPRAADDRRRPARALVGGDARRGRVRDAVRRVHPRLRDRGDLRLHRPGSRHGRDELDGARHAPTAPPTAGCTLRSASPGSRSGRSAAARPSPTRATGSPCSAARAAARCTASPRSSPPRRSRSRSRPRRRWRRPARRTSSRPTTSAVACAERR